MSIRVTFADTASRDAFANRFKLTSAVVDDNKLDVSWHFLNHIKDNSSVVSMEKNTLLKATGEDQPEEHEFIVSGDASIISQYATIKQDLSNGFYLVATTDGIALSSHVQSIEINSMPMSYLGNVGTITGMNSEPTSLDPLSANGQWARIRIASRYRPLQSSFSTHEMVYQSYPELIIMDSGIDFNHPEFDYPTLLKENFYALPVFNGDFTDTIGHGTAVAAAAVGKNLGVAEHCKLVSVKIGDGSHNATLLEVGMAIDAILTRVAENPNLSRIVNMSWGITRSSWLDAKVQSLLDAGVTVVCAAGNQGISVEDISPAGLDSVITVGSIDRYDIPSGFNNISPTDAGIVTGDGLSLDIFAPGENVLIAHAGSTEYKLASGTSLSSPMVAGVAAVIASLHSNAVFYEEMKYFIMNTATQDALLFENDKFSDNQNRVVYLFTSDPNANYKTNEMVSYLGIHSETGEPIVADLNSSLDASDWTLIFGNTQLVYGIEYPDPQIEAEYSSFISVNPVTGVLTIYKPNVPLPDETRLKMIEFVGTLSSPLMKMTTHKLFFFYNNPLYKDTLESDITLALTDTNSISFYITWTFNLK